MRCTVARGQLLFNNRTADKRGRLMTRRNHRARTSHDSGAVACLGFDSGSRQLKFPLQFPRARDRADLLTTMSMYQYERTGLKLKSLILAQIERWRHALHMQVERQHGGNPGGEWRTGE